jgi:hypothetical protein
MKSSTHGKNISKPEIANISEHGFWIFIEPTEYFLPFEQFPWFKQASVGQITNIQLMHKSHLYWPDLDVDLSLAIIQSPEKYKLVSR